MAYPDPYELFLSTARRRRDGVVEYLHMSIYQRFNHFTSHSHQAPTQISHIGHAFAGFQGAVIVGKLNDSPPDHHELLWRAQNQLACQQQAPGSTHGADRDPANLSTWFRKAPVFPTAQHFTSPSCSREFIYCEWVSATRTTSLEPVSVSTSDERLWKFDQFTHALDHADLQWIDVQRFNCQR